MLLVDTIAVLTLMTKIIIIIMGWRKLPDFYWRDFVFYSQLEHDLGN